MAFRCYLSGSMAGRFAEEVRSERREASDALSKIGIWAVDPAQAEGALWGKHLKAKISTKFRLKVIATMVRQDLWLIRRCDALLVLTGDINSDGTIQEWQYAKMIGIPIVMIAPKRCNGDISGWANVTVPKGHIVPTLKAAVNLLKRKYLKDYEGHKKYFDAAIKKAKYPIHNPSIKKGKK